MQSGVPRVRVTELANPITVHLDVARPGEFVRLLGASDSQLFTGFGGLPGIFADEIVAAGACASKAVAEALAHPHGRVLFAGCGTSGRLAHYLAGAFNDWLSRAGVGGAPRFGYLLAGGDAALVVPAEQVEDDPEQARADLDAWEVREASATAAYRGGAPAALLAPAPTVLFGVSCGLSATYVGALLEAALDRTEGVATQGSSSPRRTYFAAAVGFNPVAAVAAVHVARWLPSTFHGVLQVRPATRGQATHTPLANPPPRAAHRRSRSSGRRRGSEPRRRARVRRRLLAHEGRLGDPHPP